MSEPTTRRPAYARLLDRAVRIMTRNARSTIALPTEDGVAVVAHSDLLFVDMLKHDGIDFI